MKKNKYILLTLVCIIAIVLLQNSIPSKFSTKNAYEPTFDKQRLTNNPHTQTFVFFVTLFIFLLLTGTVHLILYSIKLFRKKASLQFETIQKSFPLDQETTGKLIFLVTLFVFCTYVIEISAAIFQLNINRLELALTLNLALELGIIGIIRCFLPGKFLDFSIAKNDFDYLVKVYITILPLITGLLLFNTFLTEKSGMKIVQNPVIGLFLAFKNTKIIALIVLQVILFGPVAEELFFRAIIYKCARKRYGFWLSAILSSVIFSMLHRTPQDILPLLFLSIVLCYVYEKTQHISAPITLHIIHNTFNLSFLMILKSFMP
ncbi:MAG: type II CAAX endopeptidase family protein [Candidatus Omnitrophota bacterium]